MTARRAKRSDSSEPLRASIAGIPTVGEKMEDFSADWCQKLLQDPSYEQSSPFTRKIGDSEESSFNSLMSKTLSTDQTLRAFRYLYKPHQFAEEHSLPGHSKEGQPRIGGELLALISLGGHMCSHANTLHGGINTMLVDEIGGVLAWREVPDAAALMAVNFNVDLRKPVKTPGIVLGRAWIERQPEGRKIWVKVRLEQDGQRCIEAESLYLKMNRTSNL